MLNLYKLDFYNRTSNQTLSEGELLSVFYHDLFDYPLTFEELIRWRANLSGFLFEKKPIENEDGLFFVEGRKGLRYKRALRRRISIKKLEIAQKAGRILSLNPLVKLVAVTGSVAMKNSTDQSDIDFLVVTQKGRMWIARLLSYLLLWVFRFSIRKPNDKNEKNKLCLNMWLDESDMTWETKDRNFYTSHEIAQIVPIVNKEKAYEKFLKKNRWILDFWPNAVRISSNQYAVVSKERAILYSTFYILLSLLEKLAYKTQKVYMKRKITNEVVTPTRALFHPQDWGAVVLQKLGVV